MMFDEKPREKESVAWLQVAAWVALIYGTIPLARSIQEFIRERGGKAAFLWLTYLCFAGAAGWVIRALLRKKWTARPTQLFALVAIGGLYSGWTWSLRTNPEEAFHFVQYGLLSLLLFRALRHRLQDPTLYVAALLIGAAFGIIDELIQWIVPRRVFDFRDIGINAVAVALMQIALVAGIRPAFVRSRPTWAGIQFCCRAAMLNILLLLFCTSNTPQAVESYSRWFPATTALNSGTAEYGYRIEDPAGNALFSRMSEADLHHQDLTQGAEAAAIISRARNDRQYTRFLKMTPAHKDPLAVEARIHLFRRDRYAGEAITQTNSEEAAIYAHVAHGENQILESYFFNTLHRSIYPWPKERAQRIQELNTSTSPYQSAVSHQLLTRFTQKQVVTVLSLLLLLSLAGERVASRRRKS